MHVLALVVVLLFGGMATATASLRVLPPKVCAALLLKMLSQDRNLKKRITGKLVIAIVYSSSGRDSKRTKNAMVTAFKNLARELKVQGMPVFVKSIDVDTGDLAAKLKAVGAGALFVTPKLNMVDIVRAGLKVGIPTMTCERSDVRKGITLGVFAKGSSPGLIVNLKAARAIKMHLDSRLLRISEVLR